VTSAYGARPGGIDQMVTSTTVPLQGSAPAALSFQEARGRRPCPFGADGRLGPRPWIVPDSRVVRRRWLALVVLGLGACGRGTPLRVPYQPVDAGVDGGVPCIPGIVTLTRARATVLFVLDRSGSMRDPFGDTSRWGALERGLSQSLPAVDQTMAVGAYLFPSSSGCTVQVNANLLPATGNVTSLVNLLRSTSPNGGTPTADALQAAAAALSRVRAARSARALVLATDGAPGCNRALNPLTCVCTTVGPCDLNPANCLDDVRTLERMTAITATGLPTWVIGIQDLSDTVFVDVLDRMAVAGGRPRATSPRFYPAASPAELEAALVAIRDQVGGCTFLTISVPDAQGDIRVRLNGVEVTEDPSGAQGWSWADRTNGELVFAGQACAQAAQLAVVTAQVGCSGTGP